MAKKNRNTLKSYFELGDRPTEGQYANLIDSFIAFSGENTGSLNLKGDTNLNGDLTASGDVRVLGQITVVGNGTFAKVNTGQGDTEVHLMNQNIRTSDNVEFVNITATGNTILGNAFSDTHTFTGHITSSHHISSSGNIIADRFFGDGTKISNITSSKVIISGVTASFTTGSLFVTGSVSYTSASTQIILGIESSGSILPGLDGKFDLGSPEKHFKSSFVSSSHANSFYGNLKGNADTATSATTATTATTATNAQGLTGTPSIVVTNVTSSGNISASGDLFANEIVLRGPSAGITIQADAATEIQSAGTDSLNINSGGHLYLLAASEKELRLGSDGTNDHVRINKSHITASGNISASGTIVASNLSGTNTGDQDLSNLTTNAQTASFAITSSNVLFGNITSSGNISASGIVQGTQGRFNGRIITNQINEFTSGQGIILSDNVNLSSHLTASGNISSSQTIIANEANIIGNITASGNISASGNINANNIEIGNVITAISGAFQHITSSVIDVDANTIRIGGTPFSKSDVDNLRDGKMPVQTSREGFTNRLQPEAIFGKHQADYIKFTVGNRYGFFLDGKLIFDLNLTGSNNYLQLGKSGENQQIRLVGNVTSSGNISASGNIIGSNIALLDGTNMLGGKRFITSGGVGGKYEFRDGSIHVPAGNITSSGTISASGNIETNTIVTNAGDLIIKNTANDKDIVFQSDDGSGGITEYFRVDGGSEKTFYSKPILLFDSTALQLGTDTDATLFHTGGEGTLQNNTGNFRIIQSQDDGDIQFFCDDGTGSVTEYIILDGGDVSTRILTNVTASGNISASGTVTAIAGVFGTGTTTINNNINTTGHITASGNISASAQSTITTGTSVVQGRLYFTDFGGSNTFLQEDSSTGNLQILNGGLQTTNNISASNISASGIIKAHTISASKIGGNSPLNFIGNVSFADDINFGVSGTSMNALNSEDQIIFSPLATKFTLGESSYPMVIDSNVTSSGNISSSGTIIGSNLSGTNTGDQSLVHLAVTGSNIIFGNITASGDISASGNIDATGNINIGTRIKFTNGFTNNSILAGNPNELNFAGSDVVRFQPHVKLDSHLTSSGNISSSGTITAANYVGLPNGTISGSSQLPSGIISSSTQLPSGIVSSSLQTFTNITASNISASGTIVGSNLSGTNTGDQSLVHLAVTSSNVIFGNITASGNISASGNLFGTGDNINFTSLTSTNITASGNISASGTITALSMSGDGSNLTGVIAAASVGTYSSSLQTLGNITSSGNISASGTIVGSNLSGTNTGDQNLANLAITGSNVIFGNITSSGNISASNFSGTTSGINTGDQSLVHLAVTGSNIIFGNITSSGNISSSGNVYADNYFVNNVSSLDNNGTTLRLGYNNTHTKIILGRAPNTTQVDITGNITASGNISASGKLIATSLNTGQGDYELYNMNQNVTTTSIVKFNRLDTTNFLLTSGSTILGNAASDTHTITGNITSSGNISSSGTVTAAALSVATFSPTSLNTGNITGSNISASGTIVASNFSGTTSGTNTGDQSLVHLAITSSNVIFGNITSSGNISASGTIIASNFSGNSSGTNTGDQNIVNLAITGSNVIFGNITSSGNISASGTIFADNFQSAGGDDQMSFTDNINLTGNLTASGNISSSGTIIANSLSLPNIASAAATDASFYTINGSRGEIRSQLQSSVAADTGWTLELRNTSVKANSLIVANVVGGAGPIITGSIVTANVVAANTASFNFFNIGIEIENNSAFTASFAIL